MRRKSKQDQTISGRGVGINNSCSSVLPARLLAGAHASSPGSTAPSMGRGGRVTEREYHRTGRVCVFSLGTEGGRGARSGSPGRL